MRVFAVAMFVCGTVMPSHAATNWDVSSGFDYSEGRYGGTLDTSVWSVPLTGRIQMDEFRLEASLPYLSVKGPGVVSGGVVVGSGGNTITTRAGVGDLILGGAWLLRQDEEILPSVELAASLKLPTAATDLGTGQLDYAFQANVTHSLSARVMLFGSLGYSWLTDFRGYNLENGVSGTAGVNYRPSDSVNAGISGSYREPYYQGLGPLYTLTPYALWTFASQWKVSVYGMMGFSAASPRAGGGIRLIFFQ
jgi:hypothetical protein